MTHSKLLYCKGKNWRGGDETEKEKENPNLHSNSRDVAFPPVAMVAVRRQDYILVRRIQASYVNAASKQKMK